MIPLRDSVRSRRFPLVTVLLIAANVIVFGYELTLTSRELIVFAATWGFTPATLFGGGTTPPPPFGLPGVGAGAVPATVTLITSTFIHAGPLHIIGNMLFLWVFGDNVEDRLGKLRFLGFYLLAGVVANVTHALAGAGSDVPVIGASGAVAGVLGAYFIAYPRARVTSLVFLGVFVTLARVPAVIFLVLWFAYQLLMGLFAIGAPGQIVAWWAHIGGFAMGALAYLLLRGGRSQRVH